MAKKNDDSGHSDIDSNDGGDDVAGDVDGSYGKGDTDSDVDGGGDDIGNGNGSYGKVTMLMVMLVVAMAR